MCGRCGCKALYDLIMDIGGEINALKFSIYCKGQNEKNIFISISFNIETYAYIWKKTVISYQKCYNEEAL